MDNKLAELAEKIYQESIEKSRLDAEEIIQNARHEADNILREAKNHKDALLHHAEQEAAGWKARALAEIRMLTDNALTALREEITHMIRYRVIDEPIHQILDQKEHVAVLLAEALKHLHEGEDGQIQVQLPDSFDQEATAYLQEEVGRQLSKEPELGLTGGHFRGFAIKMKGKGFTIDFTEESFRSLLSAYFNQEMNDLLGNEASRES